MSGMSKDWLERCNSLTEGDIDNFSLMGHSVVEEAELTPNQVRLYTRQRFADIGIPAPHRVSCSSEVQYYRSQLAKPQLAPYHGAISAYIGQLAAMPNTTI